MVVSCCGIKTCCSPCPTGLFKPLPMSIKADDPEHGDGWSLQDQETRETAEGNTPFPPPCSVCLHAVDNETRKGFENFFGNGKLLRKRPLIRLSRSIFVHRHNYPPSLFFASIVHSTWSPRELHKELIFSRGFLRGPRDGRSSGILVNFVNLNG